MNLVHPITPRKPAGITRPAMVFYSVIFAAIRGVMGRMKIQQNMKTKIILVSVLLSAGLVTGAFAAQGRGNSSAGRGTSSGAGSGRGTAQPSANCDQTGPGQGTPLRDGSGKATAPGKGAKDGSGNRANCPVPPAK